MWMARMLLTLLVLAVAQTAQADDKEDLAKLKGDWQVAAARDDGTEISSDMFDKLTITFDIATMTMTESSGSEKELVAFKIDATNTPKHFQYLRTKPDGLETSLAIYEIDGDTLRICAGKDSAAARPTKFDASKGSGNNLIVFKRKK